jgi:hypothetical protein
MQTNRRRELVANGGGNIAYINKTPNRKSCSSCGMVALFNIWWIAAKTECMNDLAGAKVLIGELLLCNAVKDISFTSKMQFKELNN